MKAQQHIELQGRIVDLMAMEIFPGTVVCENGKITEIRRGEVAGTDYIMPGLVDAHVHIESSMLIPSEFARLAVVHGTVATVSDPHEIANVLGIEGIDYMIENGNKVPFKFYFGASSCVPATGFETTGAILGPVEVGKLLERPEIKYLSEMMNYPGVLFKDPEVMEKIRLAKLHGKPVDGHAPGLMGKDAETYISAGITTDHECFTMEEALDKISYGMKIQIREGSAARNFDALIGLLDKHADMVLFCSDDKHPNDLVKGHMNLLVKRAINLGYDPLVVLRSCILNPRQHYALETGLLQPGDPADLIVVDNLSDFNVLKTYVNGILVAENGTSNINRVSATRPNAFVAEPLLPDQIALAGTGSMIRVIEALEGQLITNTLIQSPCLRNGMLVSDPERDILKIVVYNRFAPAKPAVAFIRNFGLKQGAIASTVAHDSHNIIAVGVEDTDIVKAINLLVHTKGGISVSGPGLSHVLPLPVAGLMSDADGYQVARDYDVIDALAKTLGSKLKAPFMTLSFMALLVIPQLKLSDLGLFDGKSFTFTPLEAESRIV
jgi:adenine deaminase